MPNNDYTLHGVSLRSLGCVPGHASGSNIALAGAWDLPKRLGTCFREWQGRDAVEAYVETEDMVFSGRDLTLTGTIIETGISAAGACVETLREWLSTLPNEVVLDGKWGEYQVQVRKDVKVTISGRRFVKVEIPLHEAHPTLSGAAPTCWKMTDGANGVLRDSSDLWSDTTVGATDCVSWRSFGVSVSSVSGVDEIAARRELKVSQSVYEDKYVSGGRKGRNITITGCMIATDIADFETKIRGLYWLLTSPGLRKFKLHGQQVNGFAVDGFKVTDVQVRATVTARIVIKIKEGYV